VTATQLELELWEQLQLAQQMPEAIDVAQLLDVMEVAAVQLPEAQRLQFAGDALLQMAELCVARAGVLMTQWEEAHRDPIVEPGFFADVVRQTMAVDLSDLLEPAPVRKQRANSISKLEEGSIVAPVDKAAVLAMVDQLEADNEAQKQAVLAITYSEDVTRWTAAISQWLQAAPNRSVSIAELGRDLKMPWVEVWLGVLLGNFQLEQWGEFYQSPVWVTCLGEQARTSKRHVE
jgi:hypothetical protein